ncbi:MAG: DUF167 domain-containing protein [Thaumarchaeota archaeon]|nr:DUF167 domain-containing protein [Nitrososphaerota archaeon]
MRLRVYVEFHKDFVRVEGDEVVVGIRSKPKRGKANEELVKKLAKHFGVPSSRVRIVSGFRSRCKLVEIL